MYFKIEMRLPSMNEVINANRINKYKGAQMKREIEYSITAYIMAAGFKGTLKPARKPVEISIEWHESNHRRDVDNIQSGQKFILDAMQKSGIIPNDSRRYVKQIYHKIVDDTADFVEVAIREV